MKIGKIINYDINIRPTANMGFIARVGCGRFAFSCADDVLTALREYFANPDIFEKEYHSLGCVQEVPRDEREENECGVAPFLTDQPREGRNL